EGFRAAAVDDLDPGVGGGGFVLDDFDDGVGLAALALEVQPVTVAFAPIGRSRDDGHAVGQPLGHAARVRDEVEDVLDGDADGAGVRQRHWSHVGIIWLTKVWGGWGGWGRLVRSQISLLRSEEHTSELQSRGHL